MKPIALPDSNYLNECFIYVPSTGLLYWKVRPAHHFLNGKQTDMWNKCNAYKQVFKSIDGEGYAYGAISHRGSRSFYKAHRIIWKMMYGSNPDQIDHDNRIRSDNRLNNLVTSSASGNAKNRKKRSDNSTGYTGVSRTVSNKYIARLNQTYLGTYDTALEAHTARESLKQSQGYHINHGL